MTIAPLRRAALCLLCAVIAIGSSGCAGKLWYLDRHSDQASASAAAPKATARKAPARIAQVNFGGQTRFALCVPPACPSVTRKTLPTRAQIRAAEEAERWAALSDRDADRAPQPQPAAQAVAPTRQRVGGPVDGEEQLLVLFANNSAVLDAKAKRAIDQFANTARHARAIVISGRTDDVGRERANKRLASARAAAVAEYLAGDDPAVARKVVIDAKGACCYIAPNTAGVGRHANRRVEVLFRMDPPAR